MLPSEAIHFYPELVFGRGLAEAISAILRRRSLWSRKLEEPQVVVGFSIVRAFGRKPGWGTGPDSDATRGQFFGQEVQK